MSPGAAIRRIVRPPLARAHELALRWSSRKVGLALMYHRIERSAGDPRTELAPALDLATYRAQARYLTQRYRVVPASRLGAEVGRRRRGERVPVAITFDDDTRTHVEHAAPVLRSLGVPGTVFLSGASLDRPYAFWWERLQAVIDDRLPVAAIAERLDLPCGDSPPMDVHALGGIIERLPAAARAAVSARLGELAGPDPSGAGLRAGDVRRLVELGVEVGFHTRDHDVLTRLDDDALARALTVGRPELEAAVGRPLDVVAYPHGAADGRVACAARRAGFRAGFTGRREAIGPGTDRFLMGRLEAPRLTSWPFALYVARLLRAAR